MKTRRSQPGPGAVRPSHDLGPDDRAVRALRERPNQTFSAPQPTNARPVVGIIRYAGAQESATQGLFELFEIAHRIHGTHGRPGGLAVRILDAPTPPGRSFAVLVLPPSLWSTPGPDAAATWTRWLLERHAEGAVVCSVCAGALVLAETGLLDGRAATTHWGLFDTLAARRPAVLVDRDRMVVDLGDVVTAGGVMAWTDLGLRLIERLLGRATMLETARAFVLDPAPRGQRPHAEFVPRTTHGDEAVLRAQTLLHETFATDLPLSRLAQEAVLGERTFLRRFEAATGLTPMAYRQRLRVAAARTMLERSSETVEAVAAAVGYAHSGAFARVFTRLVGMAPGSYRRRFAQRGPSG